MSNGELVRVYDSTTKQFKRYEDPLGRTLAILIDGKLQITERGARYGYVVSNNRLTFLGKELPAD